MVERRKARAAVAVEKSSIERERRMTRKTRSHCHLLGSANGRWVRHLPQRVLRSPLRGPRRSRCG